MTGVQHITSKLPKGKNRYRFDRALHQGPSICQNKGSQPATLVTILSAPCIYRWFLESCWRTEHLLEIDSQPVITDPCRQRPQNIVPSQVISPHSLVSPREEVTTRDASQYLLRLSTAEQQPQQEYCQPSCTDHDRHKFACLVPVTCLLSLSQCHMVELITCVILVLMIYQGKRSTTKII